MSVTIFCHITLAASDNGPGFSADGHEAIDRLQRADMSDATDDFYIDTGDPELDVDEYWADLDLGLAGW